jgi:hypothetical protein
MESPNQGRKNPILIHIVYIILIAGILVAGYGFSKFILSQNQDLKKKIVAEQEKNRTSLLYEKCLNNMAKTLMVAYGLSKWEAHYYSVIYYDFSKHDNIPWEIYPAVTRIESNFKCNVGSPKGAKGMMQLLEGTGKDVAENLGIEYVPNQTLWNTVINLALGCAYLSNNIQEKGLDGGVKSYLGGPDYLKSVKSNKNANQYIGEYKTTVWKEYKELSYIFRGIVEESDRDIYKEIHPVLGPIIPGDIDLFAKDTSTKGEKNDNIPVRVRKRPVRARPTEVSGTPDTSDSQ